jgi:predicted Zn-dependent peptidase
VIDLRLAALAPGVRLHLSPDRRWKTTTLIARLAAPLDEATEETALFPFVLARGTERSRSARELSRRLEDLYDAELEVDVLRLGDAQVVEVRLEVAGRAYVRGGRDPLAEGMALLGEVLSRPALDGAGLLREETFEVERENLRHEIEGLRDERSEYAIERAHRLLGRGEPSARYELGDVAALERVERAALTARWRTLLLERPLDLLVAGDVDAAEVEALARAALPLGERRLDARAAARTVLAVPRAARPAAPVREEERLPGRQAHVCVCFRGGAPYLSGRYPALLVANAVLGGEQTSRLFLTVRERDGLAYEAYSLLDRAKGNLVVHVGCDDAATARVEAAVLAEARRLAAEEASPEELADARKAVAQRVLDLEDDPLARLGFAYARALIGRADLTPEALLAAVQAVGAAEARAAAAELVHDATVVIAPGG